MAESKERAHPSDLVKRFTTTYRNNVITVGCVACDKTERAAQGQVPKLWRSHVCGPKTTPWAAAEAAQ